jgi:5-methylcytosine-specific restriction endonuclease McrA
MRSSVIMFRSRDFFKDKIITNGRGEYHNDEYLAMSTQRTMPGGWADRRALSKGPNGRNLCRWCNLEVPQGRHTFCSTWCVEEWRLRSDPGYLREKVLERDRGVCAVCRRDCLQAESDLRRLRGAARLKALADWGLLTGARAVTRAVTRKTLWDADHILPVVEGGGECDLENIRTLCLKCHRVATAALRARRRAANTGAANAGAASDSA